MPGIEISLKQPVLHQHPVIVAADEGLQDSSDNLAMIERAKRLADVVQQRWMIDQSEGDASYKRIISTKLDAILGLCETTACRRVTLLDYFGEAGKPCDNCDNCITPPEEWDGTDAARKLMSCIFRCEQASGFSFGAQQIIDVLHREGVAILLVEQNVPLTLAACQRVYIMEKGVVRHHAPAADLRANHAVIHQYLGV